MFISKIFINNLKGFRNFELDSNEHLNLITGTNNSGKTTILEAISLWYECFKFLITKAKRSDPRLGIRSGDYRLGNKNQNYIDYRSIFSVRSHNYGDIFFNNDLSQDIEIGITLKEITGNEETIAFIISVANGSNYEIHLKNHDHFNFEWLNTSFSKLPDPIGCYFSSPVAAISSREEFALEPKINNMVTSRQSFVYIRNRIYRLKNKFDIFPEFIRAFSYILTGSSDQVKIDVIGDITKDISLDVNITQNINSQPKEISLLGSGTLQILEILLNEYEDTNNMNIILLDEPDSHIHRDIQKRLLDILIQRNTNTQMFMTTHNESLIRSTSPTNIFHIDENVSTTELTVCKPITNTELRKRKTGISPSYHSKIILSLGSENSLDLLNALEADRIIFVEGEDDSEYIQSILNICGSSLNCVYWSFRGLDTLIKRIKYYKDFLNSIGCNQDLWKKCFLIIDGDFSTADQKMMISSNFKNKLKLNNYIWNSYTLESTALKNANILALLISSRSRKSVIEENSIIQEVINYKTQQSVCRLTYDEKFRDSIAGQIQNRANSYEQSLEFINVFSGSSVNYFAHYESYVLNELKRGNIEYFSNKDDVESILSKIYEKSGLALLDNSISHFGELLSLINSDTCFDEWKAMVDTLTRMEEL